MTEHFRDEELIHEVMDMIQAAQELKEDHDELLDRVKECIHLSVDNRIYDAWPLAQQLIEEYNPLKIPALEYITQQYSALQSHCLLLHSPAQDPTWNLVRDEPSVQTYYRTEPDTKLNSLLVNGYMYNTELVSIISLLHELDLLPLVLNSIPGVTVEVHELYRYSSFNRIVHFVINLPWPLSSRDLVFQVNGYEAENDGRNIMEFIANSIEHDENVEIPPPLSGVERIELKYGHGRIFSPSTSEDEHPNESIGVTTLVNLDLHMNFIPNSLINYVSKHLVYYAFKVFASKAEKLPEVHQQRIKDNIGFYDYIHQRFDSRM